MIINSKQLKLRPINHKMLTEVKKPWGKFEQLTLNTASSLKMLHINPNEAISLQTHLRRDEFWEVISGTPIITIGESVFQGKEQDRFYIPKGVKHRIEAKKENVKILEISFGYFKETDIVRLKDKYRRR